MPVEKYISVSGKRLRVICYGENNEKPALVMLPALGEISPHICFKPLAQMLTENFSPIIVEPFGYGLSDLNKAERTAQNIVQELASVLDALEISRCVLLAHSFGGVYGLNFALAYPDRTAGFIGIDTTVFDKTFLSAMSAEAQRIKEEMQRFDRTRQTFASKEAFIAELAAYPEKYGAAMPRVEGYIYSDSDSKEYLQAFANACNENTQNEFALIERNLDTVKGAQFTPEMPVFMAVSSQNAIHVPSWTEAHAAQLVSSCECHKLITVDGGHYIWHLNLKGLVKEIEQWSVKTYSQNKCSTVKPAQKCVRPLA